MIRLAAPADAARLAEVHITSWRHAYRAIFPPEFLENLDIDRRRRFFSERIDGGDPIFVSPAHDELAAFCWPAPSSEEGWGEILAIYAHPDYWGKGHGKAVLEAGEAHLREEGFDKALLWVLDSNERARRFYEGQGWTLATPIKLEEIGGVQVIEVRYEKML